MRFITIIPTILLFFFNFNFNAAFAKCYTSPCIDRIEHSSFSFELKGQIMDKTNTPLEIGNVLLLSLQDSSMLKGELFMDGAFTVRDIKEKKFYLKIAALGFKDHWQLIENKEEFPIVDLGTITLEMEMMKGVEVVARQKLFETKGENFIVNVANTSLSNSGTALDVLRNAPKVVSNSSGQFSIIGKGAAIIYLDGQQIPSTKVLENLSAADLKSIEIIENPSAKYDAAGNAVINITTKGKTLEGFKIGLTQEMEKRRFFNSYSKVDAYYRLSKFMFQTSYGIRPFTWKGQNDYTRRFDDNNTITNVDNRLYHVRKKLAHDFSFRTTYALDADNRVGLQYIGSFSDATRTAENTNLFQNNGPSSFRMESNINGPFQQQNNTLSAFYESDLDTLGSTISIRGQYATYTLDRLENIDQVLEQNGKRRYFNRRTNNRNNINLATIQIDYNKVFTNGLRIETGIKEAHITNQSQLVFENKNELGNFIVDPNFSSDYDYDENILAAYGQVHFSLGGIKSTLGLRAEMTKTNGLAGQGQEVRRYEKTYTNLFPSLSMSKQISKITNATFSYAYRIQRPQFQDLNPFIFYVDSLTSLQGNPELVPEFSQVFSTGLNFKVFNFKLNYTYTKDKINTIVRINETDDPGVFAYYRGNIENTKDWSAFLSFPISRKWYSSYNIIGGRLEAHNYYDRNELVKNQKAGFYFFTKQSFQLPAAIGLDVMYEYTSSRVDGIYLDNPISYFSVSLTRKFFNNQLRANLLLNDIFDKYKFTGTYSINGDEWTYLSEGDWHFIKLSLNYSFGKLGTSSLSANNISNSELRRINKR